MYTVVEGKDLVGKSTFVKKLIDIHTSKGHKVLHVTEPFMGHPTGQLIRDFLATKHTDSKELYALYKENRLYLWNSVIRPALESGTHVISDRCFMSSMVYQEGIGMLNVLNDNKFNIPDIIYVLSIKHDTYMSRLKHKKNLEVIEKELATVEKFNNFTRRYDEAANLLTRFTKSFVIRVSE